MKRRFILLDHSIEDSTGHYLEYAKGVLRAAKTEGFETILGVNRRAVNIVCAEADIIDKAFTRTFWENQVLNFGTVVLGILNKSGRVAGDPTFSRQYAKELRAFFFRVGTATSDIVFVPTLGGTELIGIAFYTGFKNAQDLKWHLLFRRDLPTPDSVVDAKAKLNFARVYTAFSEASKRFKKGNFFFYTDTEELTARYSKLGKWSFTTLPIPIDETLGVKVRKRSLPFVISYLGDAREEKGIHLLPNLISSLRSARFNEDRVRFRIQANLPRGGSTPKAVRAKAKLIKYREAGVEVLEGPFDSDIYHQIILTSDVILIPYCAKCYEARSSGIFAEALAAGVPTIYPEGSWMAKSKEGAGSLGFKTASEMPSVLSRLLSNYSDFESQSIAYSHEWRNKHSAKNLVRCLASSTATGKLDVPKSQETINENPADSN
jgi:glycosyltransferase involved in cell wall biosynthesis